MAKHAVLNLVPFACSRREMTDMNGHVELLRKLLDFDFLEAHTTAVTASPIGSDQQLRRLRVE
jgi:hypothetical protein